MMKKLSAIITLLCFAQVSFGAPCVQGALELAAQVQAVGAGFTVAGSSDDPFNLRLPSTLGRVTGGRNAGQGPLVINIQDLHCHAEVQRNISGILKFLDTKYGLRDVFVEGGYGRLNTAWLDGIADPVLRMQTVNALLEQGRLGGSEYFAMTSGRHDLLTGLEDERLHKDNIVRLGKILESQPRFEAKIKELRRDLAVMKARYLSAENKRFDNILAKYRAGDMTDARFYALLSAYIDKVHARTDAYHSLQALSTDSFPTIQLYRETLALQKRLRYSKVSAQLTAFMGMLKNRLSFAAYNDLLTSTDNLNNLDALAPALARVSRDHQLNIGARYPDLAQFITYREKTRAVNPMVLLRETRRITDALRFAFAQNSAERDIAFMCDTFYFFEDYLLNRLTAEDYASFKPRFEQFVSLWGAYTYTNHIRDLAPDFPLLDAYYAANDRRNSVFMDTMAPVLRARATSPKAASAPAIVVMVSGGFHTEGIARLLAQRNISYCTVTPAVTRPADAARHVFEQTIRYQSRLFGAQALNGTPLESLHPVVQVAPGGAVTISIDGGARFIVDGDAFNVEGDMSSSVAAAAAGRLEFAAVRRNAEIIVRLLLTRQTPLSLVPALYNIVDICGDMLARKGATGTGLLWEIASDPVVQQALAEKGTSLDSISTWLEPVQALAAGYAVTQADLRALRDDPSTNSIVRAVLRVPHAIETLGALHVFYGSVEANEHVNVGAVIDELCQGAPLPGSLPAEDMHAAVLYKDGSVRYSKVLPSGGELSGALLIVLFNPARASRPGLDMKDRSGDLSPDVVEENPAVQRLGPSKQTESRLARWYSADGTPWYVKANDYPVWGGAANPFVLVRADTKEGGADVAVGQAEMSALSNIRDVLDFQHALNESLPSGDPQYTAAVNGWFYARNEGAVRGGATQNRSHAQIFRVPLPVEQAAVRPMGTTNEGVEIGVLAEEGMMSAVVLEAGAENRDALASAMHSLIQSIIDQGHSFNYLVIPSDGKLRAFVFDRVLGRLPGFDDEAGFFEMGGLVTFSDPAKFFALEDGEQVAKDDLAAWARARAASGAPRLNTDKFRKARDALPQLTASREKVEQHARSVLDTDELSRHIGVFSNSRASLAEKAKAAPAAVEVVGVADDNRGSALTIPSTYRFAARVASVLRLPFAQDLPDDWYAPANRAQHLKMARFAEQVVAPLAVWDLPVHLAGAIGDLVRGRDVKRTVLRVAGGCAILAGSVPLALLGGSAGLSLLQALAVAVGGSIGLHAAYNRGFGSGSSFNAPLTAVGSPAAQDEAFLRHVPESIRLLAAMPIVQGENLEIGPYQYAFADNPDMLQLLNLKGISQCPSFIKAVLHMSDDQVSQYADLSRRLRQSFELANMRARGTNRHFKNDFENPYLTTAMVLESVLPGSVEHIIGLLENTARSAEPNPYIAIRLLDGLVDALLKEGKAPVFARIYLKIQQVTWTNRQDKGQQTGKGLRMPNAEFFKILSIAGLPSDVITAEMIQDATARFSAPGITMESVVNDYFTMCLHIVQEKFVPGLEADQINTAILNALPHRFASRLFIARKRISRAKPQVLSWFEGTLRAMLQNRFWEYIEDTQQKDPVGRDIARHNAHVRAAMESVGVDPAKYIGREQSQRLLSDHFQYHAKNFTIRPFARDPVRDLFIGDFTGCCLAMNSDIPYGMVERLIDEAMNVIEVVDEKGATIACLWLYLNADGSLVVQNIETAAEYTRDAVFKHLVAKKMIGYADAFMRHVKAGRLLIGVPGHGKYYGNENFVDTEYAKSKIPFAGSKLGGFMNGIPYYLDSINHPYAYLVAVNDNNGPRPAPATHGAAEPASVTEQDPDRRPFPPIVPSQRTAPALLPENKPRLQARIDRLIRDNERRPAAERLSDSQITRLAAKDVARWELWDSLSPLFALRHPRGSRLGAALVTTSFWGTLLAATAGATGALVVALPGIGVLLGIPVGIAAALFVRARIHTAIDARYLQPRTDRPVGVREDTALPPLLEEVSVKRGGIVRINPATGHRAVDVWLLNIFYNRFFNPYENFRGIDAIRSTYALIRARMLDNAAADRDLLDGIPELYLQGCKPGAVAWWMPGVRERVPGLPAWLRAPIQIPASSALVHHGIIGHGAQGVACLVFDLRDNELKVLKSSLHSPLSSEDEGHILHDLQDVPGMVKTYKLPDDITDKNAILMDFVSTERLDSYLARGEVLTPATLRQLHAFAGDVARKGFSIHDVYAENLFIDPRTGVLTFIDIGLFRRNGNGESTETVAAENIRDMERLLGITIPRSASSSVPRASMAAMLPASMVWVQQQINRLLRMNEELPAEERLTDDQIERQAVRGIAEREWLASLSPFFAWRHLRGERSGAALVTLSFWSTTVTVTALALLAVHTVMVPGIALLFGLMTGVAAGLAVRNAAHVHIDLHFIRETELVRALREWGGVEVTGDTMAATVWMTQGGLLETVSRETGLTPVPLGMYVRVNNDDTDAHQLYAVVTAEGTVLIGFAERDLAIDAAAVLKHIGVLLNQYAASGKTKAERNNDFLRQVSEALYRYHKLLGADEKKLSEFRSHIEGLSQDAVDVETVFSWMMEHTPYAHLNIADAWSFRERVPDESTWFRAPPMRGSDGKEVTLGRAKHIRHTLSAGHNIMRGTIESLYKSLYASPSKETEPAFTPLLTSGILERASDSLTKEIPPSFRQGMYLALLLHDYGRILKDAVTHEGKPGSALEIQHRISGAHLADDLIARMRFGPLEREIAGLLIRQHSAFWDIYCAETYPGWGYKDMITRDTLHADIARTAARIAATAPGKSAAEYYDVLLRMIAVVTMADVYASGDRYLSDAYLNKTDEVIADLQQRISRETDFKEISPTASTAGEYVHIDLHCIPANEIEAAMANWGGVDFSGDTPSVPVWMTQDGALDTFASAHNLTPAPMGVYVRVNNTDPNAYQVYAAVTAKGHIVLGFAQPDLAIEPTVVTGEISRALAAMDGLDANPIVVKNMAQMIAEAATQSGIKYIDPSRMRFPPLTLIEYTQDGNQTGSAVSFRDGIKVIPRSYLPGDPAAARRIVNNLNVVNVSIGLDVAFDARGQFVNVPELARQTGSASLILNRSQIDGMSPDSLAAITAAGKYIFVDADGFENKHDAAAYVASHGIAGSYAASASGDARLVIGGKIQDCAVLRGTVDNIRGQLEQRVRDTAGQKTVVISLADVLAGEGHGSVLQIPELMDAVRLYVFDLANHNDALQQSIERMINTQGVEAILRAA